MIGKVVKPGKGFGGLVRYLLEGDRDASDRKARATWTETRNLLVDDPRYVPALMRATAAKSKRVRSPVYHYVVSWHHNEAPSDDYMRQVADVTCADLGLDEYQRLYVAHDDTEHRHVHIVVNRVHPETGKAWKTSHDYARIEQSLARQAESMGMDIIPGRHNTRDRFEDVSRRPRSPEYWRGKRKNLTVLPRWSREQEAANKLALKTLVDRSKSWSELRRALAANHHDIYRKGQGLAFSDGASTLKLSALGKDYRVAALEARFMQSLRDHERDEPLPTLEPKPVKEERPREAQKHSPPAAIPTRPREATRPPPDLGVPPEKLPEHTAELYRQLQDARDVTSLAFTFYNAGLLTRSQLESALADQARAQAEVDHTKPLIDQLLLDTPKPQPKRAPSKEYASEKRRSRQNDRSR